MLISDLIDDIRVTVHDSEESLYSPSEALSAYNRIVEEAQALLVLLGARVSLSSYTITGDGTNYRYDLPTNCLAVAPGTLRGRSQPTATADYTHGQEIDLVDDTYALFTEAPTTVGQPLQARVDTSGDRLALVFPCILTSGHYYDMKYWPKIDAVAVGQEGANYTPWGGRLDRVLKRGVEMLLRAGAEFTGEARDKWLSEAKADAGRILGMNAHQRLSRTGSIFRGGFWSR